MVPSSASNSGPNFVLNTIVADILEEFADHLENAGNFGTAVHDLIRKTESITYVFCLMAMAIPKNE